MIRGFIRIFYIAVILAGFPPFAKLTLTGIADNALSAGRSGGTLMAIGSVIGAIGICAIAGAIELSVIYFMMTKTRRHIAKACVIYAPLLCAYCAWSAAMAAKIKVEPTMELARTISLITLLLAGSLAIWLSWRKRHDFEEE